MAFNASARQRTERFLRQIDRELDRQERYIKPFQKMIQRDKKMLRSIGAMPHHRFRDLTSEMSRQVSPTVRGARGLAESSLLQGSVLGSAKLASGIHAEVARASKPLQFAHNTIRLSGMPNGILGSSMAANLRFAHHVTGIKGALGAKIAANALRPVLGRPATDILRGLDHHIATLSSLTLPQRIGGFHGIGVRLLDTRQRRDLHNAVRMTMQASSTLSPVLDLIKESQLREITAVPLAPPNVISRLKPEVIWTPNARSSSNELDTTVETNSSHSEGLWKVFGPTNNLINRIKEEPTILVLCIGVGHIIVTVIGGGIVYLLWYSC